MNPYRIVIVTGFAVLAACQGIDTGLADGPPGSTSIALSVRSSLAQPGDGVADESKTGSEEDAKGDDDDGHRLVITDDADLSYSLSDARLVVRRIDLYLPPGLRCSDVADQLSDGARCDSPDDSRRSDASDDAQPDDHGGLRDDATSDDTQPDDHGGGDTSPDDATSDAPKPDDATSDDPKTDDATSDDTQPDDRGGLRDDATSDDTQPDDHGSDDTKPDDGVEKRRGADDSQLDDRGSDGFDDGRSRSADDTPHAEGDDKIVIEGPFEVDLLTGTTTPDLGRIRVPALAYQRVDIRIDDAVRGGELDRLSFLARADFEYMGVEAEIVIALRFSEDVRLVAPGGVEAGPTLAIDFDAAEWLDGIRFGDCLDDSSLEVLDGQVVVDEDARGACEDVADQIRANLERSGRLVTSLR